MQVSLYENSLTISVTDNSAKGRHSFWSCKPELVLLLHWFSSFSVATEVPFTNTGGTSCSSESGQFQPARGCQLLPAVTTTLYILCSDQLLYAEVSLYERRYIDLLPVPPTTNTVFVFQASATSRRVAESSSPYVATTLHCALYSGLLLQAEVSLYEHR